MSNVLVIDVGTQSMRGIIFDNNGNLLIKEQVKYIPYIRKQKGYVEQNVDMYWQVMCGITQTLSQKRPDLMSDLVAMSIDTFRDTVVLLDENNVPVRDIMMWSDQRPADVSQKLPPLQRVLFSLVGMKPTIDAIRSKVKCRWVQQNEPQTWAKVKKVVHVSAYLIYKLTGNLTDTYAASMGHIPFDSKKKRWNTKRSLLYPIFDVPLEMMVPLCAPGDVMGQIDNCVAHQSGLPVGLKLVASGSDKGCETLGVGCLDRDVASISFGTGATVQFSTQKYFEPEPFLPGYPSVLKGYYNPELQIWRGYWMLSWFKQTFVPHLEEEATKHGKTVEQIMDAEMENIPAGSDGLVLQPYWGAGMSTPEARGAIIGFCDYHTRAHVYKAIIEGIDYELRFGLERMEKRGKQKIKYLSVSGGGAQSDVVCQIAADVFNKPVRRVQTFETSGLGAAIVTFVAMGVFDDVHQAVNSMVHFKDEFLPNPQNAKIYDGIYKNIYCKLYKKLRKFYKWQYNQK